MTERLSMTSGAKQPTERTLNSALADKPRVGNLCGAHVVVGKLTLYCELQSEDGAHTHGITDGMVHQADYRNLTTRVRVQWEGRP